MLYDKEFLTKLDTQKNRTTYVRITALRFDEAPIESIEGRATGGSINIDGASAVRRTCQITMVANDYDYSDYYWGLNTKFKLEIGLKNEVDPTQPDIIWFPQGIFVITSFNTSRSTNNFSISISGKDKMCLLNGEIGGSLEAQTDFGAIEEEDENGIWTIRKLPLKDIITNIVHIYAKEPLHNIIINDLPEYGLELLEYRYDIPMYLYRREGEQTFRNVLINGDAKCKVGNNIITVAELSPLQLDRLVDGLSGTPAPTRVYFDNTNEAYYVAKIEYGQTAGYRKTDLVYGGELVAKVGESLTSVLDKIKNMLEEFEYFYDIYGRFIFQKKASYINTPIPGSNEKPMSLYVDSDVAYTFGNHELTTAFNNNPNILNLRNDYSVWGERTGISGSTLAIHMRYAFDVKPTQYTTITVSDDEVKLYNDKYGTTLQPQTGMTYYAGGNLDWRELIYQMANDYYKYNWLGSIEGTENETFEERVARYNPEYPTGRTGYEQYYTDIYGFWRDLYYPNFAADKSALTDQINKKIQDIETTKKAIDDAKQKVVSTKDALIASPNQTNYGEWQKATMALEIANNKLITLEQDLEKLKSKQLRYDSLETGFGDTSTPWNSDVLQHPDRINFWFDFLDSDGEISKYNTGVIGDRIKTVSDNKIKSICLTNTPEILFISSMDKVENTPPYKYIQIPPETIDTMFSVSAQGKSAKTKLDELIYQHSYCIESATITSIPIYYLDTNVRVQLCDQDTSLNGEYIISKISLPLAYNGTMSVTATKVPDGLIY